MAEDAGNDDIEELREQDRFLPIANINRIVKSRLPYNAKVAKESKETIQVGAFQVFATRPGDRTPYLLRDSAVVREDAAAAAAAVLVQAGWLCVVGGYDDVYMSHVCCCCCRERGTFQTNISLTHGWFAGLV